MTNTLRRTALLWVSMLAACCAVAQSNAADGTPPAVPNEVATNVSAANNGFSERFPRYKVAAGDAMDINFTFSPELNQSVTVQPDGFINLREVGDVHVQDQTTTEIADTIRKAYSKMLKDPVVSVILKDFNKPYFIAGGQVLHPGKYELRATTTLAQALQVAGGFTEASKHSEVWLYRWLPGDRLEVKKIDVKKMLAKGDLREDVRLQNGDMLFVPQNNLSKVKSLVVPRTTISVRP